MLSEIGSAQATVDVPLVEYPVVAELSPNREPGESLVGTPQGRLCCLAHRAHHVTTAFGQFHIRNQRIPALGAPETAHAYGGRVPRLFSRYHRAAVVGSGWSMGVRGVRTSGLLVACGVGLSVSCGGTTTELGAGEVPGGGGTGGVRGESDASDQGEAGAVDAYCVPGEQRTCYDSCGAGVWTCNATGTGFSECVCPGSGGTGGVGGGSPSCPPSYAEPCTCPDGATSYHTCNPDWTWGDCQCRQPATGGSGGGDASCSNVTPCGGDVVGTWNVTSSCLTVSGDMDLSHVGLDRCESVSVTGSLEVTGTWTAYADGTYSDNTTTTGTETFELLGSCLRVSGTCTVCSRIGGAIASVGYASVTCEEDPNSEPSPECGLGCTCSGTIDQAGGLGVAPMYPSASGTYTVAGSTLTITASEQEYSYCVSGTTLSMTPRSAPTTGTLTGTVVLQRQ